MRRLPIAAMTVLALAACGGGGGSDDGGAPLVTTPLALTSNNYVQASQEVVSRSFYLSNLGSFVTGASVASDAVVYQLVLNQALEARRWFARAPKLVSGATLTQTDPCDGGGSITYTINDLNGNEDADTGDSARATFANCSYSGYTANGAMSIDFTSVSGSIGVGNYSAQIAVTAENLVASSAAGQATGNGRMNIAVSGNGTASSTLTLTLPSFTVNASYGSMVSNGSVSDFSIRVVTVPVGSAWSSSTTLNGVVASSGLENKSISIATVSAFVQPSSATYPVSGQAVVTGAANSKARLTVQNATSVLIELDADGNGTYETSTTRLWSQLI